MGIGIKLTDANLRTYNDTQWSIGVTRRTNGAGGLCSSGWLHSYRDPLLAVLLDPIHAGFGDSARMLVVRTGGGSPRRTAG